jgi:hypothetical protein
MQQITVNLSLNKQIRLTPKFSTKLSKGERVDFKNMLAFEKWDLEHGKGTRIVVQVVEVVGSYCLSFGKLDTEVISIGRVGYGKGNHYSILAPLRRHFPFLCLLFLSCYSPSFALEMGWKPTKTQVVLRNCADTPLSISPKDIPVMISLSLEEESVVIPPYSKKIVGITFFPKRIENLTQGPFTCCLKFQNLNNPSNEMALEIKVSLSLHSSHLSFM